MGVQIIVRDKRPESERKKSETSAQILRRYYSREIRDGARMKLPPNVSKDQIKKLYQQ